MDAFELLLRASDANLDVDGDVKDFKPKFQMKPSFDYREHMESTMLGKARIFLKPQIRSNLPLP